jgi:biopolymer transport protein ExbD
MRINLPQPASEAGFDLTPMIDVTFQLIIFFMLLLNFDKAEQDQRVNLPVSELARPPEAPYEEPMTIQLTKAGTILFAGEELGSIEQLQSALRRETQIIQDYEKKQVEEATIIIRADRTAKTGVVQEIIEASQKVGIRKFALRSEQAGKGVTLDGGLQ